MPDDLNWDDLRFFLRAVEAKTLAGAARAMGVEHTTIGRRLSALERALGGPLVLRGPDGLKLTELGERLVPLVEEVERTIDDVRAAASTQRSRVRLAVPSGVTKLFTERLAELRDEHPGLTLELLSGARPVDLKKGEADLAIRSALVDDDDLVARKLCDSAFALFAAPAYLARKPAPRDVEDLTGHDVIGYDPSLAQSPAGKWLEAHAKGATIVMRSREAAEMVAAAVSGAGLAVLPCVLGDGEPGLQRLSEVVASRTLSLVYRREARLSSEVRAVIRFVVDVIGVHAPLISGARPRR